MTRNEAINKVATIICDKNGMHGGFDTDVDDYIEEATEIVDLLRPELKA